jgi:hypothetical protein
MAALRIRLRLESSGKSLTMTLRDDEANIKRARLLNSCPDGLSLEPNNATSLLCTQAIDNPYTTQSTTHCGESCPGDYLNHPCQTINHHVSCQTILIKQFNIKLYLSGSKRTLSNYDYFYLTQ